MISIIKAQSHLQPYRQDLPTQILVQGQLYHQTQEFFPDLFEKPRNYFVKRVIGTFFSTFNYTSHFFIL